MRVLVTRPHDDGLRTAKALRILGHDPVLVPVTRIETVPDEAPSGPFDALVATSRNAAERLENSPFKGLPVFAVGPITAQALTEYGFTDVRGMAGSVKALVGVVMRDMPAGSRLLYVCGATRKDDGEVLLRSSGYAVTVHVVYRAVPIAADLPEAGAIDAIVHYSRASAERFLACLEGRDDRQAYAQLPHLCLSADVAAGLAGLGPTAVAIASKPDEASLFSLMAICRS